ncbi:tryptophan-rich sensory protein [Paenisporosarcina quisquiliarum]|uniref:Tryptophan-rich sensory protein n=1 Tax=Paenisporosarcina quisquiliarum TaxID=365346 RepID=A0A9X3LFI9_9BACL|nr:tryptophan-rich sensory protein [Paenisporosarcina quisquiliarum]
MVRFALMVIALIGVIAINALANILPLNNQTTGEISNRLPVLFTPAGYVFSIWSVIYVLLIIWLVGMWKKSKEIDASYIKQSNLFIISCILNIAWIFLWHYEYFLLTVVVMIAFLVTLILLYSTYPVSDNRLTGRLPISIYLGWISVATIANISYVLTVYQWNGWGLSDPLWAVIMMTIGTALALHIRFHHFDIAYVLVFIWAFIGIAVRNGFEELLVSTAALFLSAFMLAGILFIKKRPTARS